MSAITWSVEFDWLSDGVYVDEAARTIALSVRRGREYGWSSSGRTPMRNGEATITLNNWDRRYDPGYNLTDAITDTFTDEDALELALHTPDAAPAGSAWERLLSDDFAISSNKAIIASGIPAIDIIDSGISNISITVTDINAGASAEVKVWLPWAADRDYAETTAEIEAILRG